ncbi:MAG: phage head-tail adapter protein, partial [Fusobacterium periodonticum]|nr:phage head-tail adapter protein [Fusobacterium periodonticum]
MEEILKDMKLGQIIGVYHFEDSCFTVGKILKIDSKYLYLFSYDVNFKEDGIKIFLINSIKRIILKSDYIEKNRKKIIRFNRENKDIFQELIKNRVEISIELADGSVEEVYLIEKGEDYFSFQILNDNENITSEEIITKDYLKRIKISNYIE